ncbi:Putative N-acetylmannosaminyltransferase [Pirellula sp. SH-Sr6A]|uniref:WecB/TagA/CpsF family glycosyltransferase n=1 Tax=Pirellula sp. SH-Sr6A TaxID=1632865 RepID=UPI00078CAD42|nr:WecB/TagA/CpsF family glycosyltransferase [Pirellula sp. SH-Sr6A]AMV34524.1 Putative N-acetylmannosaminyltransferase [Pirellula sp. SH-Sr6A]
MSNQSNESLPYSHIPTSVFLPRVPRKPPTSSSADLAIAPFRTPEQSIDGNEIERKLESRLLEIERSRHEFLQTETQRPEPLHSPLPPLPETRVWGVRFHAITMEETLDRLEAIVAAGKPSVAITANLNYAMLCDKHPRLRAFTERAALVLCDGKPVQWRSRLERVQLPERVTGADLIYRIAERSARTKLRIFLYGAAEGIAEKAARVLTEKYPGCCIAGVLCPPFRTLSEKEKQDQIQSIRDSKPDVLLIALGQPKGEFWIEDNLEALQVPLAIQVGASFDFVAGKAKRAPRLLQTVGAEWLYRTFTDPRRLAPRYAQNAWFLGKSLHRDLVRWFDAAFSTTA